MRVGIAEMKAEMKVGIIEMKAQIEMLKDGVEQVLKRLDAKDK